MHAFALTLDVDGLRFYQAIHGMSPSAPSAGDPIYTVGMPRFWSLVAEARAPATLFVVGEDAGVHAAAFTPVEETGSEIASHSFRHDYRLSRAPKEQIAEDLSCAHRALLPLNLGRPILGFRAPGYNVSPALLEAVVALGYRYDSSLLPAPAYFAARATAIGAHALLRHPSRSLIGDLRQFLGPLSPYRMSPKAPWNPEQAGALLELPMACAPWARAPLIGTSWTVAPNVVRRGLLGAVNRGLPSVVLELHAIDLVDRTDHPSLLELSAFQRDLWVPAKEKMRSLSDLIRGLKAERESMTCAELASRWPRV